MGEAGIWIAIIVVGTGLLGALEYARSSGTFAARLEQVKFAIMAGSLVVLVVLSGVLAVLFIIAVVLVEIWRPLLVVLIVTAGLGISIFWLLRRI